MDPKPMPAWLKRVIVTAGLLLALPGLIMAAGYFCLTLVMALGGDREAIAAGLVSFTLMMVTIGAGGAAFWHALRSLQKKPSKPLPRPPIWLLAGIFALAMAMGLSVYESGFVPGLLFPPILFVVAALPPLMAVLWFSDQSVGGLTWRRGLVAFAGGATVSVFFALVLQILFPTFIFALVFGLGDMVLGNIETLFDALAGENISSAVANPGFIYLFIQIALIAPLVEELAKPLVTLPLLGRLSRRDAFLIGTIAGAGFATLENILYAGFGFGFWAGILLVRALGAAIHPLGSGLTALGWRGILRDEANAWTNWFIRSGLAVGIHALWNGGSLLIITLAGASFFGQLPPEINILGLFAAGTTLALLIVLGLTALWLGRAMGQKESPDIHKDRVTEISFTLSNKAAAIWALACLVTVVPAGIAGLQILVR